MRNITEMPLREAMSRRWYAHLLEASGLQLEPASCVYLDGLAGEFELLRTLDRVDELFATHNFKPKVVLVRMRGRDKPNSKTMKWLRSLISEKGDSESIEALASLEFYPAGRTTTEANWEPAIYFSIWLDERQPAAFFSINKWLEMSDLERLMREFGDLFCACAAYGLYFPKRFSPSAYFYGLAAPPSYRGEGTYSDRDSERLVQWRQNSLIGTSSGAVRRFHTSCDGYVRDAYPSMLLSDKHMRRRVGESTLAEAIDRMQLGHVTQEGERFLWRIPAEKLGGAQRLLDENDISLSGRRLE